MGRRSAPVWVVPQEVKEALDLMAQRRRVPVVSSSRFIGRRSWRWRCGGRRLTRCCRWRQFIRETLAVRMLGDNYL